MHAAMHAAGLRSGDTVLHVGRYFSLRDAMKWARRMQVPFSHPGTHLCCLSCPGVDCLLLL